MEEINKEGEKQMQKGGSGSFPKRGEIHLVDLEPTIGKEIKNKVYFGYF